MGTIPKLMKNLARYLALLSVLLLFNFGCGNTPQKKTKSSSQKLIYSVNYPLYYFATQITKNVSRFKVVFPVPQDWDPAFWKPTSKDIKNFQDSDLILLNGADYAKWVRTATLPQSKLVNTSSSFENKYIINPHAITHSHGPYGMHTHGKIAFTTWMDMSQAIIQANAIYKGIINKLKPSSDEVKILKTNLDLLVKNLNGIDKQFTAIGKKLNNAPIMASHPVYKYFARRYKLFLKDVHWEPTDFPSEAEWQKLSNILASHSAKLMIWEEPPLASVTERLGLLKITPIVVRHCGNKPPTGDFISEMKNNISRLSKQIDKLK